MKIKIASAQYAIKQYSKFKDWQTNIENWVKTAAEQNAEILLFPEFASLELVNLLSPEVQKKPALFADFLQCLLPEFKITFDELATKFKVTIIAPSFPVKVENAFYNRVYVFGVNGLAGYQDKLFMTNLDSKIIGISSPPKKIAIFKTPKCTFGIQICYDSEFSIGANCLAQNGAEILLIPSCTETIRGSNRVHISARARALEQQFYTVVSQVVGDAAWNTALHKNYGYAAFYAAPDTEFQENGILEIGEPQEVNWLIHEVDTDLLKTTRSNGQVNTFNDHKNLNYTFNSDEIKIEINTVSST
ncbi:MAG: hypothetical protein BGO32_10105 [Bacteroidetes bacterium 37-13]|nr:MAG: hypothetical protein BGO32_10105 [Bacteroidetes bacterium 37-13]